MGMEALPDQVSPVAAWTKVRAQAPLCGGMRSPWGRFLLRGDTPGRMLNRVDVGVFPISRWNGVTIIPLALGRVALRAELQVVRKARHSLLSSSMASASG